MRRSLQRTIGFAILLPLVACQPAAPPAPDTAAVKTAIEAANAKFIDAWKKGDTATMIANYDAEAIVFPPNEVAWRGREGLSKGFAGMMSAVTLKEMALNVEDVMVRGDLAVENGTYSMTMQPKKGAAITDKGKYLTVWKQQADGSWKLLRDIFNTDLPAKM